MDIRDLKKKIICYVILPPGRELWVCSQATSCSRSLSSHWELWHGTIVHALLTLTISPLKRYKRCETILIIPKMALSLAQQKKKNATTCFKPNEKKDLKIKVWPFESVFYCLELAGPPKLRTRILNSFDCIPNLKLKQTPCTNLVKPKLYSISYRSKVIVRCAASWVLIKYGKNSKTFPHPLPHTGYLAPYFIEYVDFYCSVSKKLTLFKCDELASYF